MGFTLQKKAAERDGPLLPGTIRIPGKTEDVPQGTVTFSFDQI